LNSFIQITEKAISQLKLALADEKDARVGVRVGLRGGGCSGMTWVLDIEDSPKENDLLQTIDNVKVYIDPISATFIQGTELDYVDTLQSSGFVFKNEKVSRSCGCGKSVAF